MICIWAFFYSGKLYEGIWKTQHKSEDKEIKTLSKTLPFVIESRLTAKSNKKYFRGWKNWLDWSSSKQGVISCPADSFYIAIYLNHVLFITGTTGSVIAAFYGIRWGHHVIGFNSPTKKSFCPVSLWRVSVVLRNRNH